MNSKVQENLKIAKRISLVTILWNIILSIVKMVAGLVGNSGAMIADGIHSISDVATTALAYLGVKMGSKSADENHPYGHEKFEPVHG